MKTRRMQAATASQRRSRLATQAGQAVVLMAVMMVAIIGAAGLAVDSGIGHYYNVQAEKAASAAALAGVVFMPYDYEGAQVRAREEARRNGFDEADTSADVHIIVERVPGYPNRLKVTVSRKVQTFFMPLFGISSYRVQKSARASYLPPIGLGQPGNQIGASASQLGNEGHEFIMVMEGWKTDREQGDPFTPDPRFDRGIYQPSTDVHWISKEAGNEKTDDSLPDRGGYNFEVSLPHGGYIQVYNAVHGPDGNLHKAHNNCDNMAPPRNCNPNGLNYYFHEEYFMGIDDTGSHWEPGTNPLKWLTMQYTVFRVQNLFNHTDDQILSQVRVHPIDATNWNDPTHQYTSVRTGAVIDQHYDVLGRPTNMKVYHAWTNIANPQESAPVVDGTYYPDPLPAGTYRLRVDALDYNGNPLQHGAAFKAFAVRGVGTGVQVSGWNDMTIFTPFSGAQFEMPIFQLPPEYRGKEISIEIFDPGDILGVGDVSMSIISPSGAIGHATDGIYHLGVSRDVADSPDSRICSDCSASFVSTHDGVRYYNGDWVRIELRVPDDYCTADPCLDNPNYWWWKLRYTTGGAHANDTLALAAYLKGKGNPARQLT